MSSFSRGFALALALSGIAGAEAGEFEAPHHAFRADHMILDAALRGDRLLVATQSGRVDAYDWRKGTTLENHRIGLIEMETGQILGQLAGHTAPIQALAFTSGGSHLISAGNDARVLVWNIENPEENERP